MNHSENPVDRFSTLSDKFLELLRGLDFKVDTYTMDILLQRVPFLSEKQAVLGINDERQPILFDLNNSRLQSLLIINDHLPSIRKLILTIIRSLRFANSAFKLQYIVISDLPDKWMAGIAEHDQNYEFCGGVVGGDELSAQDWILYLAQKVEQRLYQKEESATIILFVDDLAIIERMDDLARKNFSWLLKYGAMANIWVIAGLDLQKVDDPARWLPSFTSKIFGSIAPAFRQLVAEFISEKLLSQLSERHCFITKTGSQWIRFWAPKLQG